MNYYDSKGAAKRLRKKLDLLKSIKTDIDMLRVNMRYEDEKEAIELRIKHLEEEYARIKKEVV